MRSLKSVTGAGTLVIGLLAATLQAAEPPQTTPYSPYVGETIPRNVYWGDLHVHSNLSPDSYSFGRNTRLGPDNAYRFAKGEAVDSHIGEQVQLRRPLDFLMVADHAEFIGVFTRLAAADSAVLASTLGKRWGGYLASGDAVSMMNEFVEFLGDPEYQQELSPRLRRTIWQDAAAIADRHNDPGKFTAFVGYEWTSQYTGNNLHRVVVFKDDASVAASLPPFSSLDSQNPEDLWQWLADYESQTGGDVLAIPHNGNLSNGLMFPTTYLSGEPMDAAYAKMRSTWEPLYETTQVKGDAEAHPLLSPDDEFADYETWDTDNISRAQAKQPWMLKHEYARSALQLGLQLGRQLGTNPYQFGLIGSTDSHTTLSTADENNFWGKFADSEPIPKRTQSDMGGRLWNNWRLAASGYAAIWARENTRAALFEAMERKEVYATTGPRITLRFFGGWEFSEQDHLSPDPARVGYAKGVPMGGTLAPAPDDTAAPGFLISALRDPEGANLDRLQVIKGWINSDGETQEKVYDVALSDPRRVSASGDVAPVGNTVNIEKATYTNSIGAGQLEVYWQDPDFDPSRAAFYYVRVLEIPTPRWSTYDAAKFGLQLQPEIPRITQERAYSSPIWYTP